MRVPVLETADALSRRVDDLERTVRIQAAEIERLEIREQGMSAEETMDAARRFVASNPDIWFRAKRAALDAVEEGRPFSMRDELRKMAKVAAHDEGEPGIINAITPALVRMMILDVPALRGRVRLGRSKVDKYFPSIFEAYR